MNIPKTFEKLYLIISDGVSLEDKFNNPVQEKSISLNYHKLLEYTLLPVLENNHSLYRAFLKKGLSHIELLSRYSDNELLCSIIENTSSSFQSSYGSKQYNFMLRVDISLFAISCAEYEELKYCYNFSTIFRYIDECTSFILKNNQSVSDCLDILEKPYKEELEQYIKNTDLDTELAKIKKLKDETDKLLLEKKVLDDEKPTTNDLDTLEEQKDDPQPRRIGRDFNSAQWVKKPKQKAQKSPKKKQEQFSIRTFQQVYDAIDQAIEESGEKKNEWIVRAIMDRLQTDHPDIFQSLKDKKDEFPDIRSDARTGIDFIYE